MFAPVIRRETIQMRCPLFWYMMMVKGCLDVVGSRQVSGLISKARNIFYDV